jgi:hypothetical protein
MSSNASSPTQGEAATADVAAQLASAIDECAAAARRSGGAAEPDLCGRLATMWAMLTDADPELAACAARYAGP